MEKITQYEELDAMLEAQMAQGSTPDVTVGVELSEHEALMADYQDQYVNYLIEKKELQDKLAAFRADCKEAGISSRTVVASVNAILKETKETVEEVKELEDAKDTLRKNTPLYMKTVKLVS